MSSSKAKSAGKKTTSKNIAEYEGKSASGFVAAKSSCVKAPKTLATKKPVVETEPKEVETAPVTTIDESIFPNSPLMALPAATVHVSDFDESFTEDNTDPVTSEKSPLSLDFTLPLPQVPMSNVDTDIFQEFTSGPSEVNDQSGFEITTLHSDTISLHSNHPGVRIYPHREAMKKTSVYTFGVEDVKAFDEDTFRTDFDRLRFYSLVSDPHVSEDDLKRNLNITIDSLSELTSILSSLMYEDMKNMSSKPSPYYLNNKQPNITAPMRAIVIDWMVNSHAKFKSYAIGLHNAVALFDRFLNTTDQQFNHTRVQLVACACLSLTMKLDDVRAPGTQSFAYVTDFTWSRSDIRQMENEINQCLNFQLSYPAAISYAHQYFAVYTATNQNDSNKKTHTDSAPVDASSPTTNLRNVRLASMVDYIGEIMLMNIDALKYDNNIFGAAIVAVAMYILQNDHPQCWTIALTFYSGFTIQELQPVMTFILQFLVKIRTDATFSSLSSSYEKYAVSPYKGVSHIAFSEKHVSGLAAHITSLQAVFSSTLNLLGISEDLLHIVRGIRVDTGKIMEVTATRQLTKRRLPNQSPSVKRGHNEYNEEQALLRENLLEYQVLWRYTQQPRYFQSDSASEEPEEAEVEEDPSEAALFLLGSPKHHLKRGHGSGNPPRVATPLPVLQISRWIRRDTLSQLVNGDRALLMYKQKLQKPKAQPARPTYNMYTATNDDKNTNTNNNATLQPRSLQISTSSSSSAAGDSFDGFSDEEDTKHIVESPRKKGKTGVTSSVVTLNSDKEEKKKRKKAEKNKCSIM